MENKRKKILIDGRRINDKTGFASYLRSIIISVAQSEEKFYLLLNTGCSLEKFPYLSGCGNIGYIYVKSKPFSFMQNIEIPYIIYKNKIDVFHSINYDIPIFIKQAGCSLISTIHDIIPLKYPEYYKSNPAKDVYLRFMYGLCARISDLILTVSDYSKEDIASYFHIKRDKIKVIYNSYIPKYQHKKQISRGIKTILSVGTNFKHKNILPVIEAVKILKEKGIEIKYNIAGAERDYTNVLRKAVSDWGLESLVKIWGGVADETLDDLYESADYYVCASLAEGFGIPLLEAMNYGLPVISSNKTVMPEVVGNAGILTEPDAKNFAESIELLINSPDLASELISRGYERIKEFSPEIFKKSILSEYKAFQGFNIL